LRFFFEFLHAISQKKLKIWQKTPILDSDLGQCAYVLDFVETRLYQYLQNNTVEESCSDAVGEGFNNGATDLQAKYDRACVC
jgi:hypothetical protein